jgi:ATP-dependent DNA helicase RecG
MIARTFYRRGIIETWGRGTLKIARLMRERGLEPPTVAVREGAVVVTFALPAKVTGEATGKTTGKATGKTTGKAHEAVLTLLAAEPSLSIPEVATRIGKGPRATERIVRALREAGRLERVGPAKGGHWRVIE